MARYKVAFELESLTPPEPGRIVAAIRVASLGSIAGGIGIEPVGAPPPANAAGMTTRSPRTGNILFQSDN